MLLIQIQGKTFKQATQIETNVKEIHQSWKFTVPYAFLS